ncbi:MAG: hypothetical protein KKG25_01395, partial [Bacteroidetes bacterium]|nr:hypothetical protein [Bacteroidota bacterium]
MKILLINSPLFRDGKSFDNEDSLPPLGIGYIATYIQNNGVNVELIDAVEERISLLDLTKTINEKK